MSSQTRRALMAVRADMEERLESARRELVYGGSEAQAIHDAEVRGMDRMMQAFLGACVVRSMSSERATMERAGLPLITEGLPKENADV